MRVEVLPVREDDARDWDVDALRARFNPLAQRFGMAWELGDRNARPRVLIMVSRQAHCLNDLLFRYGTGDLRIEVPAIVSNHNDLAPLADDLDLQYLYIEHNKVCVISDGVRSLETDHPNSADAWIKLTIDGTDVQDRGDCGRG